MEDSTMEMMDVKARRGSSGRVVWLMCFKTAGILLASLDEQCRL